MRGPKTGQRFRCLSIRLLQFDAASRLEIKIDCVLDEFNFISKPQARANRLLTPWIAERDSTNLLHPRLISFLSTDYGLDVIARPAICFCLHPHSPEIGRIEASHLDLWSGCYCTWIALTDKTPPLPASPADAASLEGAPQNPWSHTCTLHYCLTKREPTRRITRVLLKAI